MSNVIKHRVYKLELDIWKPFEKQTEKEIDELINGFRERKYLGHAGNVRMLLAEEGDVE